MRVLNFLTAALLPLIALAEKAPGDRFERYHAKQLSTGAPVKIDDAVYKDLTRAPRDYSVAVLLTALEARIGCVLCNQFQPEWNMLGKQWVKGDKAGESKLLFATLDFADGQETFRSAHMPTPTLHLADSTLAKVGITATLGFITFGAIAWPYVMPVIQNRNLWAGVSLIAVLLFTSGQMYNHIRGVPYVMGNGKGKIEYFASGFQNQVGMETQLVAAMYGILAFATISLALKVPRMADPRSQQLAVMVWSAVLLLMYSLLISVFKFKNGGYPLWLPPF